MAGLTEATELELRTRSIEVLRVRHENIIYDTRDVKKGLAATRQTGCLAVGHA